MHFYDFIQLNETEQIELLWYNGQQIGRRKEQEFLILLYQVDGFYVEVFYHNKERVIKKYLSFECTDHLEPYIGNMDISSAYKYMKRQPKAQSSAYPIDTVGITKAVSKDSTLINVTPKKTRSENNFWDKLLSFMR